MRPFPNLLHAPRGILSSRYFPDSRSLGWRRLLIGTARMPSHSFFKIQCIGLAVFAALLGFIALLLLWPVAGVPRIRAWRPDSTRALVTYIGSC